MEWPRNLSPPLSRGQDTQTTTGRQTELFPRKELWSSAYGWPASWSGSSIALSLATSSLSLSPSLCSP